MVDMWTWHFGKTQLQAHVGRRRATIWADELDNLIARGLMVRGAGAADAYATMTGKELISRLELVPNRLHGATINERGEAI